MREAGNRRARRRAEQAAAQLAAIVDSSDDAIISRSLDGLLLTWNPGAERLFGWMAHEVLGTPMSTIVPPDKMEEIGAVLQQLRRGERVEPFESVRLRKDGTRADVSITASPLRNPDGLPYGYSWIARDISAQKQLREGLARRLRQQSVVADLGRYALQKVSVSAVIQEATRETAQSFGCEFCGVWEVLPDGLALRLLAGAGWNQELIGKATVPAGQNSSAGFAVLTGGPVITDDFDTETRFKVAPLMRAHGVVSGISVIIQVHGRAFGTLSIHSVRKQSFSTSDVNFLQAIANVLSAAIHNQHTQDALGLSQDRVRYLVQSNLIGVISWDTGGGISEANDAFLKMIAYSRDDLVGGHVRWGDMTPPEYRDSDRRYINGLMTGGNSTPYEKELISADGRRIPILMSGAMLAGSSDQGVAFVLDISELKRAEVERDEHLARLQMQIDRMPLGYVLTDADFRIIDWNPAAQGIFGYSKEEMLNIGPPLANIIPAQAWPEVEEVFARLKRGDMFAHAVAQNLNKAGQTIFCEWHNTPLQDRAGKFIGVFALVHDITARQKVETALRTRDGAIQAVTQGILITDPNLPDNPIIYASPALQRMTGYRNEEIIGRNCRFLQGKDTDPLATAQIRQALEQGQPCTVELLNYRKDGTSFWNELSLAPVLHSDGRLLNFVGVQTDVTKRHELEEQYRRSQERLRSIVSTSPAVLYSLGRENGRFTSTWTSDNIIDMLGFTPEECHGREWYEQHLHPEESARIEAEVMDILKTGHLVQEYRIRHRAGNYRWLRDEKKLVSKPGAPVEIVGSWSDITERKELEDQFRQSQKMEAFGKLAGGVAHDFNNLLTIIMGYCEIILSKLRADDPLRVSLTEIRKAGERATSLTRQLLAFSRKQVLAPVVLDLNLVLNDFDRMLRRLIGEDIEFTFLTEPDLWFVKADPGQMEQMVMNLVVNARDAMPKGGKILLETKNVELNESYVQSHSEAKVGMHVLLAITDTGCGMDANVRAQVFEPFFTTKGPTKGTGLGLATVFGIVKQSGGHIEFYSEVDHGTTFKIYLPRDPSGEPVARMEWNSVPVRGGTETLLLVEDEDGVRNLAASILQQYGYKVLDARHGGDALIICETHTAPIDLMLTDVIMPHFSGRQLAQRLAIRQPAMKVLYMSGYTDDAVVLNGVLESGMPFLHKPFAPEVLARKVREVLDRPHTTEKA